MSKVYTIVNRNDSIHLGIFSTEEKAHEFKNEFPQEIRNCLTVVAETLDDPWSATHLPYLKQLKKVKDEEKKKRAQDTIRFNQNMIARMQKEIEDLQQLDTDRQVLT